MTFYAFIKNVTEPMKTPLFRVKSEFHATLGLNLKQMAEIALLWGYANETGKPRPSPR